MGGLASQSGPNKAQGELLFELGLALLHLLNDLDASHAETVQLALDEPDLATCSYVVASGVGSAELAQGGPHFVSWEEAVVVGGHSDEKDDDPDEPVGEYAGINLYAKPCRWGPAALGVW